MFFVGRHSSKIITDDALGEFKVPKRDRIISGAIQGTGVWEPHEIEWIEARVTKGTSALNVGANFGYFSRLLSRLVGDDGQVFAFEPNPELFRYLSKNMQSENVQNYKLFQLACGSTTGTTKLFLNESNLGDNRVFDPRRTRGGGSWRKHGFAKRPKSRRVRIMPIDSVLRDVDINFALIDVQGWELEVIRGMRNIIERCRPTLLVEFTPQWLQDLGENPLHALEFYRDLGYSLSAPQLSPKPTLSPSEIISELDNSDSWYTNVGLTPTQT